MTLLFFLIEVLPVTVKLLLSLAPPTAYDKVAESQAKIITDQADLKRIAARRDAERESDEQRKRQDGESRVRVNVADDMRRREEELGVRANEHVAREMETILDAQLDAWARQVQAQLGLPPQGNASPNGNGTQQGNVNQHGHGSQYGHGSQHGNGSIHGSGNGAALGNITPGNGTSPVNGGLPPRQPGPPPPAPDFGLTWDGGLL